MTMRTTTLRTAALIAVTLATLAGCSAYPEAIPNPGAMTCASAEELFSEPAITPAADDDFPSSSALEQQPRLSEAAVTQLRQAVPPELNSDIDTLLSPTVDVNDAAEHLQEWAIRACGIEVAFTDDGTTAAAKALPNDIYISGEQGTTISITGDADHALTACEAEVKRGGVPEVLVLDQFGIAVASWEGQGPCVLIDRQK